MMPLPNNNTRNGNTICCGRCTMTFTVLPDTEIDNRKGHKAKTWICPECHKPFQETCKQTPRAHTKCTIKESQAAQWT